jgi:hypothetical protein
MLGLLVYNPIWITNNQQTVVINFHQDFEASTHYDFFKGQTDRSLFFWPNYSKET